MKSFIERVFMSKRKKQQEIVDETINTENTEKATEAAVEAIIKKVKQDNNKQHTDRKDD
jgi:hypothetical protein